MASKVRRLDSTGAGLGAPLCALWAFAAVACSSPPAAPPPAPLPVSNAALAATPEREDDAVVARVNDLPVYASCVTHQATLHQDVADLAARRRQALDDCLGFELLAQRAAALNLTADRDVLLAGKTAAVSRLVERELEARVRTAAELPTAFVARIIDRQRWRMHRVNYRASFFIRFVVDKKAPAGGPQDQAARAAAERVAAALAGQRGMFPNHVSELARSASGGQPFEEGTVDLSDAARLVGPYADALFAIPEIGRTAPAPARTEWGWDVILWTHELTPREITEAELAEELFPEMRLAYFASWSKALGKDLRIERNPAAATLLDDNPAAASAPLPAPAPRPR